MLFVKTGLLDEKDKLYVCYTTVKFRFLETSITRTNVVSLSSDDHCNFSFSFSHYPFFEANYFPLEVRKIGISVYIKELRGY